MIEELVVAGAATYPIEGRSLSPLKRVNFLFGTNGSGKTTISRVLADPASFPDCTARWANGRPLETLVFNSDYADRNYASEMPGIFTLGESSSEILAEIEQKRIAVTGLLSDIDRLQGTLGPPDKSSGKLRELEVLTNEFTEACWTIKQRHDEHFQGAFTGVRNSKRAFCDRILKEVVGNKATLAALPDLQARAKTVFAKGLERLDPIAVLDGAQLIALEQHPVLAKKIVGKDDLEIAVLIKRLGNSDWVRSGLRYLDASGESCPFCQQAVSEGLGEEIKAYFDETYANDMAAIAAARASYERQASDLVSRLSLLQQAGHQHIDRNTLQTDLAKLSSLLEQNLRRFDEKAKEPSTPVSLAPAEQVIAEVLAHVAAANEKVSEHNELLDNLAREQATLKAQIWRCVLAESDTLISQYTGRKRGLDQAVGSLTQQVSEKQEQLQEIKRNLRQLEARVTSVLPTVNAINRTLESFGFTSFRLATAGDQSTRYQIVRPNGADATRSLSEGERSFITFLYFFHLIRGSLSESGINEDRIVVIDDPVSSLDSDVLFIVSTLIKQLLDEAHGQQGRIKQVIVLTHNIYFHKEVSFDQKRKGALRSTETFWIVRKVDGVSDVKSFEYNPIKTSYQLLWDEVKNPNRSKATIQNTLRRIVENYFKILGNQDKDEIIALFEGRDKQLVSSLFAWVNDGSHSVHDDLYVSADDELVERYLRVFKEVFERTNHLGHYNMMMGIETEIRQADAPAAIPAGVGPPTAAPVSGPATA